MHYCIAAVYWCIGEQFLLITAQQQTTTWGAFRTLSINTLSISSRPNTSETEITFL